MSEVRKDVDAKLLENDEYRRLKQEHRDYEQRLDKLSDKTFLNDEEQREIALIKKRKLQIKDRMLELASQARAS